jgi:iron complex outermembrane recepter protein
MSTHVTLSRALRSAIVAASVAAAGPVPVVFAQDAPSDSETAPQTVTVTGSRIARPELEAPAPVLSLSAEQLEGQGLRNLAEIAAQTPQFAASFGTSRTQSTFSGAASSGLNLVNLRNLAGQRTLVLINGRRVPAGSVTTTSVDFNTIPTANIDRLEILTGGASAVYGADSVSGTINIITKKVQGLEVGANYSAADRGDNESPGGYLMYGTSFADRGYGSLTVQYEDQGKVSCADRFICQEDFLWQAPDNPIRGPDAYSAVGATAKFQLGTSGTFFTSRNGSFTDAQGALIPFSIPVDGYNRNPDRTLAIPTERLMVAAAGDYEITPAISAFTELNYGSSDTKAPFEGNPFQSTAAGNLFGPAPNGLQASIPVSNPFIPAALRARLPASATVMNWQQRFNSIGDRGATNERTTVRGVLGLKGEFAAPVPAGGDWNWEFSHVYGRTKLESITDGLVGTDRLYNGLRVEADPASPGNFRCVDAAARAAGCIPINPFAPYTQAMKDYLNVTAGQHGRSELQDTNAFVGGPLFNLPAGALRAVLGVERRSFTGFLDYDDVINQALVTGNQIQDIDDIKTTTNEIYAETAVPILKDIPFVEELEFNGSYRYSNPNRGDNYKTWGAGLVWEPVKGVRFRANQARAVRTPVPGELSGLGQTFGVVNDPCIDPDRNQNATRAANCLADGVPTNYRPPATVTQSVSGFVGGNPDLDPERGDTTTVGIVLTPSLLRGFSLSVDHFKVDLNNVINTVGRQSKANLCYDSVERFFCEDLTRGVNVNTEGNWALLSVNDQLVNVARLVVGGYDVEARYAFNLNSLFRTETELGELGLNAIMTFYDQADETPLPGQPVIDLLGFAGGSTSDQGFLKRQGVMDTRYSFGKFKANWHMRYIGRTEMSPFVTLPFPDIGSHLYHDLRLSFAFRDESEVYLGIYNLSDKEPPFFASGASGTQALDTIPAYYDVFGRSYFGGVRMRF